MTSHLLTHQPTNRVIGLSFVNKLLATDRSVYQLPLRLSLAAVFLAHGAQKALGWFGGYGWEGTMGFLTGSIGMPALFAAGVILLEFIGPLLLVVGLATRPIALAFAGIMIGAIATVHAPYGFFMNWDGSQAGEGFEFHLLAIGSALALAIAGGGRWSLDGLFQERGRTG